MRLINILPVRNEGWCIGLTVRAMLRWVDHIVIGLHCCTDNTVQILAQIEDEVGLDRMSYRLYTEDSWHEMAMRQDLLTCARLLNPTHISILDADEILTGNLHNVRRMIEQTPAGHILQLPGYNLRNGLFRYHSNGIWGNRWFSMAFADSPSLCWYGDRFHHREPLRKNGSHLHPHRPVQHGDGGVMHLWGASEARLREKHRLYKVVERLRYPAKPVAEIERDYDQAERGRPWMGDTPDTWTYADVPLDWWAPYFRAEQIPIFEDAINLREPWQREHADALIAKHGRELFAGLSV